MVKGRDGEGILFSSEASSPQRRYSHFWSKEQNELSEGEVVQLTDC